MDEFRAWHAANIEPDTRRRTLWIRGGPGVGKSTMAGYIVDILQCLYPEAIVAYFFCKSDATSLHLATEVVRTLAYQCIADEDSRAELESLRRSGFRTEEPVGIRFLFRRLLADPILRSKADVYIILDGLDEADNTILDEVENRPQIDILLECLPSLHRSRLIVLSRPPLDLLKVVPNAVTKSITSNDNKEDLQLYVRRVIDGLAPLQKHFEKIGIDPLEYFVEKANGIFLWVVLVLQQLKFSCSDSKNSLQRDLNDLFEAPGDNQLDKQYSVALCRNSQKDQVWITAILRVLTVAVRNLEIGELQSAIEIALNDEHYAFKQFLEVKCGSFLQLVPISRGGIAVQPIHETFVSYLVDPKRCLSKEYFIDRVMAHSELATWCLNYLSMANNDDDSFVSYASTFWVEHLRNAGKIGEHSVVLLISLYRFFTSQGCRFWVKHGLTNTPNLSGLHVSVEERSLEDISRWLFEFQPPLRSATGGESELEVDPLRQALEWRCVVLEDPNSLGEFVGKAAATIWLNDEFTQFNQIATSFSLAVKYYVCSSEHFLNTDFERDDTELQSLVADDFIGISAWAAQPPCRTPNSKNLGVAYFTLGIWEECVRCFLSVESMESAGFKTLRYLGEAYAAMGRLDEAIKSFINATEDNPKDSLSWIGLADAHNMKGDHKEAIRAFLVGREKNKGDIWFWRGLGYAYLANGNYNEAIETFQAAIENKPSDSTLWIGLGEVYKKSGDFFNASKTFRAAIERFPTIMQLREDLIKTYAAIGDFDKMDQTFERAIEDFPTMMYQGHLPNHLNASATLECITQPLIPRLKRSVWLFTGEVAHHGRWKAPRSNWEVLITPFSKIQLEDRMRGARERTDVWGHLHALWNHWGTAEYRNRKFLAKDFKPASKLLYEGETEMTDHELEILGIL